MPKPRQSPLQKVLARSLCASPAEVATFNPDHNDLLIAEALLAPGATNWIEVAALAGLAPAMVKERLMDAVRAAWLSAELVRAIPQRSGMVLAAVYGKAVRTGDPAAAKLLLGQYGQLNEPVARTEHKHLHVDLTGLTTDELKTFIAERRRELGIHESPSDSVAGDVAPVVAKTTEVQISDSDEGGCS